MKVLIICTYFPPDSAIAAVRPYMIAKYMSKRGHKVVVLRSGEIDHKPDPYFDENAQDFCIITYQGDNSDVERYKRGEFTKNASIKYRFANMPRSMRTVVSKTKKIIFDPFSTVREIRDASDNFKLQKKAIDQIADENFDIVFSTYADLENIFAGEYASNKLKAKWIMDFRDPMVWYAEKSKWAWNLVAASIQRKALRKADLYTCVSEGLRQTLLKDGPSSNIVTMYNGYEEERTNEDSAVPTSHDDVLRICYTGQFYALSVSGLETFIESIASLIDSKRINREKIKFVYAGNGSELVKRILMQNQLIEILDDHGLVDRNEAKRLQKESDAFLVLAWNTKASQGVLTGKFYEGIRAKKPIISVIAGDLPNSELLFLNKKYNYGFCFEICQKKTMESQFLNYIAQLYDEKTIKQAIDYVPDPSFQKKFRYDNITKDLEEYCFELLKK